MAAYYELQGRPGDAIRHKRDADSRAEQWKLSIDHLPMYPQVTGKGIPAVPAVGEGEAPALSAEQIQAVKDLLNSSWKAPKIASVLGVSVEEVEKVKLDTEIGA